MDTSTMRMLLDDWRHYTFDEKISIPSQFLKEVERKLRKSHGYSTQDDISKDLELSKRIIAKLNEEVTNEAIERRMTEFRHHRDRKRVVEILCDLADVWEYSYEYLTQELIEQMKSKICDLDDLLPLLHQCRREESNAVRLLRLLGVEVTEEPKQSMDHMNLGRIQSMINEHTYLHAKLVQRTEEAVSSGRPLTSLVAHLTLRGLISDFEKIAASLEEAIG